MPNFSYVAKLQDGRTITGALESPNQEAVIHSLHGQGLVVLSVRLKKSNSLFSFGRGGFIKVDDLAIFTRQMATLVDAGIPIVGGLEAVAGQMENKAFREVIIRVYESVEGGMNLTAAIAKQSAVFSPLFISMVKAGETSGHLSKVLDRLAIYLEKSASLQRKVKSACIYPAIVIGMAVLITALLMLKVIPVFKEMFSTLGADLPLPTKILIGVSDGMRTFFFPVLGLIIVGISFFRRTLKTKAGRLWWDGLLLKLAIVGPLVRKVAIAKFSRTFATLVKSGVQILAALEIVSETAGNAVVAEAVLQVKTSIKEGENIAGPLAASGVFPPIVVRMIAVGEQTGRLEDMLTKIAESYEDQVDTAVSGLTSAIEPIIIAVLGLVVGGIVISIFLPIFKLTQMFSK